MARDAIAIEIKSCVFDQTPSDARSIARETTETKRKKYPLSILGDDECARDSHVVRGRVSIAFDVKVDRLGRRDRECARAGESAIDTHRRAIDRRSIRSIAIDDSILRAFEFHRAWRRAWRTRSGRSILDSRSIGRNRIESIDRSIDRVRLGILTDVSASVSARDDDVSGRQRRGRVAAGGRE